MLIKRAATPIHNQSDASSGFLTKLQSAAKPDHRSWGGGASKMDQPAGDVITPTTVSAATMVRLISMKLAQDSGDPT
jgi:hypothetical protein